VRYRGDRWARAYCSPLLGQEVEVLRNMPRRRVLVLYMGQVVLTFQWCLESSSLRTLGQRL